jgi:hypothetical protein
LKTNQYNKKTMVKENGKVRELKNILFFIQFSITFKFAEKLG